MIEVKAKGLRYLQLPDDVQMYVHAHEDRSYPTVRHGLISDYTLIVDAEEITLQDAQESLGEELSPERGTWFGPIKDRWFLLPDFRILRIGYGDGRQTGHYDPSHIDFNILPPPSQGDGTLRTG